MQYRIFVSHAWNYHNSYQRVLEMLDSVKSFSYANYSVPYDQKFARMSNFQLKEELKEQIRPVNCVIALAGVYMSYSDWIQFELDYSVSLDKPIIGIIPWGQQKVSTAVSSVAKELVGWNTDAIVNAIKRYSI